MLKLKLSLFAFAFLFVSQSIAVSGEWRSYSHSQARPISSVNILSDGDEAYVGLWIKLKPHWHTYWENPGDSGAAPILKWQAPGVEFSSILWPTPQRTELSGLQAFGYAGEVFLLQKVKLTSKESSPITFHLQAEWLVCDEICVPQKDNFQFSLGRGEVSQSDAEISPLVEAVVQSLPRSEPGLQWSEEITEKNHLLLVQAPWPIEPKDFFASKNVPVSVQKPQFEKINAREWKILFTKEILSGSRQDAFEGLFFYTKDGQEQVSAVSLSRQASTEGLWTFVLWAFLGGLILNLMPCVLPVLMLKAFSLVKHTSSSLSQVRRESGLYTLGVLMSLWILSGLIVLLQKAGRIVGWGFQLQSPVFNLILVIVFVLLSLNLLGLFDIQIIVPRRFQKYLSQEGNSGALATGFLSVVVASPCTAPFMGAAIGFALAQPLVIIFLIFTSLGLGLAFPYILISFFPATVRFLPKPGAWMDVFKKALSIPLLLTAVWLSWVFYQQVSPAPRIEEKNGLKWTEFSEQNLNELRGKKAVFIDFTADWCLSCKVNERLVFNNEKVLQEIRSRELILMKADWTNYDPKITEWLKKYNRAGVPFYILIPINGKEVILPELLTPPIFINSLKKLSN